MEKERFISCESHRSELTRLLEDCDHVNAVWTMLSLSAEFSWAGMLDESVT